MKQVAVLSGKGGTGKTSVVAAFAELAQRVVTVDADVDAANLALLLPGADAPERTFFAGRIAVLDRGRCTDCGACVPVCRFGALRGTGGRIALDALACEGCGACLPPCEPRALALVERRVGTWTVRTTCSGPLVHAELDVGQPRSGKLVAHLREEARRVATEQRLDLVLIDGPPGIGCPVHAAVTGVDLLLFVAEPSVSGAHDLGRALALARQFRLPAAVALNKCDLTPDGTAVVEALASSVGIPVVGRIPFSRRVPELLGRGRSALGDDGVRPALEECWRAVRALVGPADEARGREGGNAAV
jgi:MinD superfamily P-loop ATPase